MTCFLVAAGTLEGAARAAATTIGVKGVTFFLKQVLPPGEFNELASKIIAVALMPNIEWLPSEDSSNIPDSPSLYMVTNMIITIPILIVICRNMLKQNMHELAKDLGPAILFGGTTSFLLTHGQHVSFSREAMQRLTPSVIFYGTILSNMFRRQWELESIVE
jgi:hypothetical protein